MADIEPRPSTFHRIGCDVITSNNLMNRKSTRIKLLISKCINNLAPVLCLMYIISFQKCDIKVNKNKMFKDE